MNRPKTSLLEVFLKFFTKRKTPLKSGASQSALYV